MSGETPVHLSGLPVTGGSWPGENRVEKSYCSANGKAAPVELLKAARNRTVDFHGKAVK